MVRSMTELNQSHPFSSHLFLAVSFSGEGTSCKETQEGMHSSAALPSGRWFSECFYSVLIMALCLLQLGGGQLDHLKDSP